MSRSSSSSAIATLGIDLGKNSFHLVGQDQRGAIVLRIKLVLFRKTGEHFFDEGGSPCPRHALRKSFGTRRCGSP